MTRNKGNNGDRVHFNLFSYPWVWERDPSAMHTTFHGTQSKKIINLSKKELSGKA